MNDWIVTLEVTIEANGREDALKKVAAIIGKEDAFSYVNVYDAEEGDTDAVLAEER